MLMFRNEPQVDVWCAARGILKGDARPVQQVWAFSREWYGRHMDTNWNKWSVWEAAEIFKHHKLSGPIWTLSETSERF
jgi:hypothetical protein